MVITVLVNWNGWKDTIECVESLLAGDYPAHRIVIVDNGSKDDSVEQLASWARRGEGNGTSRQRFSFRHIRSREENGCQATFHTLVLIEAGRNRGFAGGVNVGIRYAMSVRGTQYVWVLNNDTVVAPDCLSRMVARMRECPGAGMCGSQILYYAHPEIVQALGGAHFNHWLGTSFLIGADQLASAAVDPMQVERRIRHLSGASMLVSRRFVETVGLMDEQYFLYYEEADWAVRAGRRFRMAYAHDARVYHKEGASIGSSAAKERRSIVSTFFLIRSRIRFTRKFYPFALPLVIGYALLAAIRTRLQGQPEQARAMLKAILGMDAGEAIGWRAD